MGELIKRQDKRRVFVDTLDALADERTVVITCDVGFNYLEGEHKFKVLNLGITEQSSAVIAATLALSGFKVFFYSMIPFVLFRPLEMVRNAIICHKAPVTIIGVKGSESYKLLGFSHNLLHDDEDTKLCDNIGLAWKIPVDEEEVSKIVRDCFVSDKPLYIRL